MNDPLTDPTDIQPSRFGSKVGRVSVITVVVSLFILVGLLLPAIAQIREAARRAQCQNNLKQLALAAHNYESASKKLPVGIQVLPGGNDSANTKAGNWSWLVFVDPYIEARSDFDILDTRSTNNLSDRLLAEAFEGNLLVQPSRPLPDSMITKSKSRFHPDNSLESTLRRLPGNSGYRCPSDSSLPDQNDFRHGVTDSKGRTVSWPGSNKIFNLGITNYVVANSSRQCYGMTAGLANDEPVSIEPDGMFNATRSIRSDDIGDGDSNTIMFSERIYGSLTPGNDRSRFGRVINAGAATVFGSRGIGNSTIDGSASRDCADAWGAPDVMFSAWGGINLDDPTRPWRKFQGVSSYHTGGVNIALGDGSVCFFANMALPDQLDEYHVFETTEKGTVAEKERQDRLKTGNLWRLLISVNDGANKDLLE